MDLATTLTDPELQSSLIPLLLSIFLTGVLRVLGGQKMGGFLACAAVGVGFVLIAILVNGIPAFPPRSSGQKIVFLVGALTAAGVVIDLLNLSKLKRYLISALLLAAAVTWIALPLLKGFTSAATLSWAVVVILSSVALFRLMQTSPSTLNAPTMVLCSALAVGAVAMIGATATITQYSFALAALIGGFLLWNWPKFRFPFGTAAILGGGGALALLVTQQTLFTRGSSMPLLALVLVFFCDRALAKIKDFKRNPGPVFAPIILGAICMIPVALVVGTVFFLSADTDPYLG